MSHRYLIGSGYHWKQSAIMDEFFAVWLDNVYRHSSPSRVVLLCDSGSIPPSLCRPDSLSRPYECIKLDGNLGYHLDILHGAKPYHFPGGPAAVLTLAMIAYCDEADFVYKEQDMLWFGDCVGKMQEEIGGGGVICGRCQDFPVTNSLFMVKHAYIPEFVRLYLGTPPETSEDQLCERKFERFVEEMPDQWKTFSFGYDRDRPFNTEDPVWYAQQFTKEEMHELRERKLL